MVYKFPLNVPTYNSRTKEWTTTHFETPSDLKEFVLPLFKEPGQYNFTELSLEFNSQAQLFRKQKNHYCLHINGSKAFREYWNFEKKKCRRGVIFTDEKDTFFLPRDYYHFVNFLQIPYKDKLDPDFATVWDGHYHLALYELLAELHYKHSAVLKKRQFGASLYHIAKLFNIYIFEKTSVLKIGAALKTYLGMDDGNWKMLTTYRDFNNEHTAWYRANQPDTVGSWQQRTEVKTPEGKVFWKGLKSSITSTSFEKSPTAGVGGPCTYFFHEEGGIAPKADKTLGYMDSSLKFGLVRTGMFIISGSVGELDQCGPLKTFMTKDTDFYRVKTNLLDEKGTEGYAALFIPEQWNMPPFIDRFGNSQVKEAMEAIKVERARWEEMVRLGQKTEEEKRLEFSQHPTNIAEAFQTRKQSVFPTHIVQSQLNRIDDKEVAIEYLDIERGTNGGFQWKRSNREPLKYPTEKSLPDKRGCVIVSEKPTDAMPEWGMYYASVDTIGEGKTTTSDSLFCIQIYKIPIERTVLSEDGKPPVIEIEGDKIVATWTGRYDDPNDSHELASMLIEAYNAWTIVEANVSLFITYMILKKRQKYLVPKSQIVFLKELESNQQSFQEYGWKNTGSLFKNNLLRYGIEYVKEIIDETKIKEGHTMKLFGVRRIPDRWLLQEMMDYDGEANVDRLVTFCALVAFVKLQVANRGFKKIVEKRKENLDKSRNMYKLSVDPFRNIGKTNNPGVDPLYKKPKSTFKHLK